MKILGRVEQEAVTDVRRDICDESTRQVSGNLQFRTLEAQWDYGTAHDGECYEVQLCERCFFTTLAYFKQERWKAHQFESDSAPAKWNWPRSAGTIGSATVADGCPETLHA